MKGEIENILAALNAAKVRYLVVGGVAVVLHGHLRTTMKREAGRPQDLADVESLAQLRESSAGDGDRHE